MKRWLVVLVAFCFALPSTSLAQVGPDEADDDWNVSPVGPIQAGKLEVNPIMSFRMSGGGMVYQVGAAVGYSLTRHHQLGGSFVMGNKLYTRTNQRQAVVGQDARIGSPTTGNFSGDQGFGSSLTGYYRFNVPIEVSKRTYPHVEVFAGRDFGWGDFSEVGAGFGFRKFVNRTTALTSQYSYVILFAGGGENLKRHVITAGFTVFLN
jgi:hypothetical protein